MSAELFFIGLSKLSSYDRVKRAGRYSAPKKGSPRVLSVEPCENTARSEKRGAATYCEAIVAVPLHYRDSASRSFSRNVSSVQSSMLAVPFWFRSSAFFHFVLVLFVATRTERVFVTELADFPPSASTRA